MGIQHGLETNLTLAKDFNVEAKHTADHIGSGSIQVLATPMMIAFMEITSLSLLDKYLPDGYSSVGSEVNVRHLAPSPLGSTIRVQAGITQIEGERILLDVKAWEGQTLVGIGSHTRHLIEVKRFMKRVKRSKKSN
jgi:predicted thioesterase